MIHPTIHRYRTRRRIDRFDITVTVLALIGLSLIVYAFSAGDII